MPRFLRRPIRTRWSFPMGFFRRRMWILPIVILLLIFIPLLWTMEKNIDPVLMHIAITEVKKEAQIAITKGIEQQIFIGNELKQLVEVEKAEDGRIVSVQLNPLIQAKVYTKSAKAIEQSMEHLKDKPIKISLGQIMQSTVFANYGPDIPVEIWQEGSAKISLEPQLESKGINMVLVTVNLKVETDLGIIVPFNEDTIRLTTSYPIAQTMVVGEVPAYYYNNNSDQSGQGGSQPVLPPVHKEKH